jgi:hypothetical protein
VDLGLPADLRFRLDLIKKILLTFVLSNDTYQGLLDALERAEAQGESDRDKAALKDMDRFVGGVEQSLRHGELTPDQASELLREVDPILDGLAEQAAQDPAPPDRRKLPPEPLPSDWNGLRPPYRWRPPMVDTPGDFPTMLPKEAARPVGAGGP